MDEQPIQSDTGNQPIQISSRIPRPIPSKIDEFIEHLRHASKVVQSWPAWKQEILGGRAVRQNETDKHQYKLWEE